MKKYVILFISAILLISCSIQENKFAEKSCPSVFISKEHKDYFVINKNNPSEEMIYIATINNFSMKCKETDRKAISSVLDILFVLTPLDNKIENYKYHYFVSILDNQGEVLDYQIFEVKGKFSLDENKNTTETVITESLDQYLPLQNNLYKIFIGFVLDEKKYKFINN